MANLSGIHRNTLTNEQLAHWIGGKAHIGTRSLSDEYDRARENVHVNPETFAALMPAYMSLIERLAR